MKILSHRGYWTKPSEKNSIPAFLRALECGFGLETDIRDCAGRIVVSHDMPMGGEVEFERFIELLHDTDRALALNIKADGLAVRLKNVLSAYEIKDWFVFDMSVPDMRAYLNERMPVFARVSEVERDPPWIDEVIGIWFDHFYGGSYDVDRIAEYLRGGRRVCVVAPELHGRPYQDIWQTLAPLSDEAGFMICTDYPEQARRFFTKDGR
jgi:glycerophosphoryl diester phosphodiesterase